MNEMMAFLGELSALQAELAEMTAATKRAEAAGDSAALDELIAKAIVNRGKLDALMARATSAQVGLNRKARRIHQANVRKVH